MSLEDLSKEELFSRIRELEEKLKRNQKYGLVWEDKPEDVVLECEKKVPVLRNIKERSIRNDKTGPVNVLIEGDNYHALKILNYTHKGKVDVIYIDPPYNTGNKDFIYNDSFVDSEDGYRHSKWLSFMERRLKLAKELLKDTGVIFISIDDNEQAQLKLLCDGVFGEGNFVSNVCVVNNLKGRSDDKHIATANEYLLVYSNHNDKLLINGFDLSPEQLLEYNREDNFGKYKEIGFRKTGKGWKREDRPNMFYPIYFDEKNNEISLDKKENFLEIFPLDSSGNYGRWRWGKDTFLLRYRKDIIIKRVKNGKYSIFTKMRLTDTEDGFDRSIKPKSLWVDTRYDTSNGSRLIADIFFDKSIFDNPKPLGFVKDIFKIAGDKNAIILDFFAGSGTTGHAVLELNKEDGGNRQFILVTNNGDEKSEHKIAEKITYERLKRVMNGYKNKKGEKVEGLGGNLEYLKCDFIDKVQHEDNMKFNLAQNSTDIISFKENAFDIDITKPSYKIIKNVTGGIGIYHDLDDSDLDKMYKDLEKFAGTKSAYIFSFSNPKETIEKLKDWKDVNIQEMPNIN